MPLISEGGPELKSVSARGWRTMYHIANAAMMLLTAVFLANVIRVFLPIHIALLVTVIAGSALMGPDIDNRDDRDDPNMFEDDLDLILLGHALLATD